LSTTFFPCRFFAASALFDDELELAVGTLALDGDGDGDADVEFVDEERVCGDLERLLLNASSASV
jgi:hypothetical protein